MSAECPQSSHLTLHGTSFTEKFLSKAMRDFSSTVQVPPPRSSMMMITISWSSIHSWKILIYIPIDVYTAMETLKQAFNRTTSL